MIYYNIRTNDTYDNQYYQYSDRIGNEHVLMRIYFHQISNESRWQHRIILSSNKTLRSRTPYVQLAIVNIMERDITDRFVKWTGVVWFNEDKQSGTYTIRLRRAETPVRGAGERSLRRCRRCVRASGCSSVDIECTEWSWMKQPTTRHSAQDGDGVCL
ncbi:hypothetical protein BJX62DRAFT_84740 [Aspergillus germanicus]